MEKTLRVLLRRDPSRDRDEKQVPLEGYAILWPDGRGMSVGFDAFCRQGQRLLGIGKRLNGCREKLIDLIRYPLTGRDDGLTRLPGLRIRRFCLCRTGRQARLHFLDGTPTAIVLDLDRDDPRVLDWIGLTALADGESHWFDLAARTVEDGNWREGSSEAPTRTKPPLSVVQRSLRTPHAAGKHPADVEAAGPG